MENQIIRTFGRIHGKRLSARQQSLLDNLLPTLAPDTDCQMPAVILEIGFGAGEHLMQLARDNPDAAVIGAEPYMNGVASLLSAMTEIHNDSVRPEYKNIRIWPDDARKLLSRINYRFSLIYILHPDPWPKARHEKRRLCNAEFLTELAAHLAPGGKIIIGTDHMDYYDWIADQVKRIELNAEPCAMNTIATRYQRKDMFGANTTKYISLTPVA
ncbi:MAG: hypothetical protein LBO08_02400 [Rickettsiales bacterium]|jgi:tRNA (guanine-N7-)-methyltransferase|nr:hypothetical protein [Rickettsiales bacterium]